MKTTSLSRPLALLLALGFMPLALSARPARAQDASLEDPAAAAEPAAEVRDVPSTEPAGPMADPPPVEPPAIEP